MADSIVLERHLVSRRTRTTVAGTPARRRVYILPTRYGLLFGLMIIVMLIGGINYNNSMAYVLTFILGSVVLVGILFTYQNLAGLVLTARRPEPVFCGQSAGFPVLFDNRDSRQRCSIQLDHTQKYRHRLRKDYLQPGLIIDVPEASLHTVTVHREMRHRGLIPFGRLRISTTFPLGLFRAWAWFDIDRTCIVYPRPEGALPLPESVPCDQQEHAGQQPGADDFAGFRNYRPGDPGNTIAWKQYAREQDLMVKRFHGQGSHRLMLGLQQLVHLGNTEQALSQLCRWIVTAEQQGLLYGLELDTFRRPPDNGFAHMQDCLEALARYDPGIRHQTSGSR